MSLKDNLDLAVGAAGIVMVLAAITVLAGWPWALLAAGIMFLALATLVIE